MIARYLALSLLITLVILPIPTPQAAAQDGVQPPGTVPITPGNAAQVTLLNVLEDPATSAISAAFFTLDNEWIVTSSDDATLRQWSPADQQPAATIGTFDAPITALAYSPDGSQIATGGDSDGTVRRWSPTAEEDAPVSLDARAPVTSLAYSPDGSALAAGGTDGRVRLWNTATGAVMGDFETAHRIVRGLAFSPDGSRLATAGADNTITLWAVTTGDDGLITVSDPQTLAGHQGPVWSVAFSPDGSRLASGSVDERVRLWDVATGDEIAVLSGHTDGVTSVAFSPDGSLLASGSHDWMVHLWDVASGESIAVLVRHTGIVSQVSFSPDGTQLVSAGWDGIAAVWGVGEPASDDVVRALFEENAAALEAEDLDRYMATLNPESPHYRSTAELMQHLFETYDLAVTIDDLMIMQRTDDEITVRLIQTTTSRAASDFSDNRQTTINMLRQYRGRWLITQTVVVKTESFE